MSQNLISNKQDCVQFYLDNGFVLFALNGKVPPAGCKWRERTYDPFFEPSANFGVQLRSCDLVIDIDPRNGGTESFEQLKALMVLPETLCVITGSGGQHIYLSKPEGLKIHKSLKAFKGIDFLSDGCYVVGAGSLHPETQKEYILTPGQIQPAPINLLELIEKRQVPMVVQNTGVKAYVTDDQTRTRYVQYLETAQGAIEGQSGDQTTFVAAATGRDYGLHPDVTFELLLTHFNPKCVPPWEPEALRTKVQNAYRYTEGQIGSANPTGAFSVVEVVPQVVSVWVGEQYSRLHKELVYGREEVIMDRFNVSQMFREKFPLEGLLAIDLFSHNIIFRKRAPWHTKKDGNILIWNDDEAIRGSSWLSQYFKFEPKISLMHEGALAAAYDYQFHPVKDYFESLVWDGHKRVHNWMHNYLGCKDDEYVRAVGLKTLVACVKRIYEPGCKFDYITVLEGHQDTGKSTAWRILASDSWFGDTPIDISKEWSIMKTFGKMMYEWAEMETFRKSGTQAMKAFLSSSTDTVRLPYNRTIQAIPRQGIFVGSFNPEADKDIGWLHDTTGNRRYWVVETSICGDIRNDKLRDVRDQLWAEALVLYRAGVPIYFEDSVVIKQAQEEQAKRLGKDAWHNAIQIWVNAPHNLDRRVITGDEIFKECIGGNLTNYGRPEMSRIARVMGELGWVKGSHHHPQRGERVNGYKRPMIGG